MPTPRGLSAIFCLLALIMSVSGCKKHQTATIIVPPAPSIIVPPASSRTIPKPKRAPTRASTPAGSTANQPASTAGPRAPETPRLGQMLSSEEERQYNALIDQTLSQTEGSLRELSKRSLTPDQQSSMREIQELMRQANAARKVDLVSARSLADKAQVLARDLTQNAK